MLYMSTLMFYGLLMDIYCY